jgi:hypothetical protein
MHAQCHNYEIRPQIKERKKQTNKVTKDTKKPHIIHEKTTQFYNILHIVLQHTNSSLTQLSVAVRLKFPTDGLYFAVHKTILSYLD